MSRPHPQPDVSVVIPARNAEPYLADCLRSVLRQTSPASEVLVVDDHSEDRTAVVARSFGDGVRVLTNPARGVASALNFGIAAARSGLIAHFDADDLMRPDKLECQVALYQSPNARGLGFVGSDLLMFDDKGPDPVTFLGARPLLRERYASGRSGSVIWLESAEARRALCHEYCIDVKGIYPKAVWAEVGGFDESMRCVNDMDFVWRVARRRQIAIVDHVLVDGRRHSGNLSKDGGMVARECIRLFRRMLSCDLPDVDRRAVRRRLRNEYHDLAHSQLKSSNYPQSLVSYLNYALTVA